MKKTALLGAVVCLLPTLALAKPQPPLKTHKEQLSYALGVGLGKNLKQQGPELNIGSFMRGVEDAYQNNRLQLSDAKMASLVKQFHHQQIKRSQQQSQQQAKANLKQAQQFLTANKKKSGVKTLPSGLQYKVLKVGKGSSPTKDSTVTVDYSGRLINGMVFDSSYQRGKPATFPLSVVIPGWQQAIPLMKEGAVWELYVPPKLGYKDKGVPGVIGPDELLIFKVHLRSVKD